MVCIGFALGAVHLIRIAQLDENGISLIASKPLTWDFTNLWYGGRLALDGRFDILFNIEEYREGLRSLFAPYIEDSEWSYPPTMLLVGAPLALLPLYPSYAVWTLATLGLLTLILYRAGLPAIACALLWLSPAALNNIAFGQNGALTAALLLGGLLAAERRPVLAGLLFGLLTVKPQLGILVPICLAAGGYWRTMFWSVAFAALLCALTILFFGVGSWIGFLTTTQPLMRSILEAPWGEGYQANAMTVFVSMRGFGLGVTAAYAVQAVATSFAAVLAWRLWRHKTSAPLLRAAATAVLTLLATPYGFSYDLVVLACAVLVIRNIEGSKCDVLLAPLWLWPSLVNLVNAQIAPLSPLIILYAAWLAVRVHEKRANDTFEASARNRQSPI